MAFVLHWGGELLAYTISIFTIMNPLSAGAIMVSLMEPDASKEDFSYVARRTSRAVLLSMLILFFSGTYVFSFFGINPDALRVFGGIILLAMGIAMVQGQGKSLNHTAQERSLAEQKEDITIVPLAIPIIVGPGLATTLLTLSAGKISWTEYILILIAILLCGLFTFIILNRMPFIKRVLKDSGIKVFNRIMGIVVGSLAVQMIIQGAVGAVKLYAK